MLTCLREPHLHGMRSHLPTHKIGDMGTLPGFVMDLLCDLRQTFTLSVPFLLISKMMLAYEGTTEKIHLVTPKRVMTKIL